VDLHDELLSLVTALDSGGVDYALIGGMAVAVWGAPRFTQDIDLLIQRADLERAKAIARQCGFTLESFPMDFTDGTELHRMSKMHAGQHLMVDLMLVARHLQAAWDSRRRIPFDGGELSVISRDSLIAMKIAAGRQQDLLDVEKLKDLDR
jgi:Nucleotidyl transferase AbiEii toxin, Type IV TA system